MNNQLPGLSDEEHAVLNAWEHDARSEFRRGCGSREEKALQHRVLWLVERLRRSQAMLQWTNDKAGCESPMTGKG